MIIKWANDHNGKPKIGKNTCTTDMFCVVFYGIIVAIGTGYEQRFDQMPTLVNL